MLIYKQLQNKICQQLQHTIKAHCGMKVVIYPNGTAYLHPLQISDIRYYTLLYKLTSKIYQKLLNKTNQYVKKSAFPQGAY